MASISIDPIGILHSPFAEKFGVPRQPNLATHAEAILEILPPYNREEAFRELEAFSHIWLIFHFHQAVRDTWKPSIRPPRLGGNQRIGVFASRSPFRPNNLGLSVVALERIEISPSRVCLHLRGADLVDGTPVLDIKPYVPYADALPEAVAGFAAEPPTSRLKVRFSQAASDYLAGRTGEGSRLFALIEEVIALDPRPAYRHDAADSRRYGMTLAGHEIAWSVCDQVAEVIEIKRLKHHR